MQTPFYSYKQYMIDRYGEALFRVPIDLDFGCPNRDPDGTGGCTFCPVNGARAQQTLQSETVEEQVHDAIEFSRRRYRAKKFMAYFQAYTSTFAPASEQRALYERVLQKEKFDAVSIGTRPDCLSDETLDYLCELNKTVEVWIELGVQTAHNPTLERINRGHTWEQSREAIVKLHERGLKVAAHVILGLPGETAEHFQRTAEALAELPLDGVKLHNLHLIRGTQLAFEYVREPFHLFGPHEYAEHVIDFIRRLSPQTPIMRLTTDTPDEELVAPIWRLEKGQFLEYLQQQMVFREYQQGDLFGAPDAECAKQGVQEAVVTDDGSVTFFSKDFKEHYHASVGARTEAEQKFIAPSNLEERLTAGPVRLLDVCFGLGYNSLCAVNKAQTLDAELQVDALEIDRRVVRNAAATIQPHNSDAFDWKLVLERLYSEAQVSGDKYQVSMHWGDARWQLQQLSDGVFDLVYLDAFSTQKCSELWTVDFFRELYRVMKPDASLFTYCAALPVRSGLLEAGFYVGETEAVGRARGGTIASKNADDISLQISETELDAIRNTTRGLPYRDPYLCWTNKQILRHRQELVTEMKQR
ncbi:TIGR01212 family radical SAM protein [Verrucomicrobiota bacterium]